MSKSAISKSISSICEVELEDSFTVGKNVGTADGSKDSRG